MYVSYSRMKIWKKPGLESYLNSQQFSLPMMLLYSRTNKLFRLMRHLINRLMIKSELTFFNVHNINHYYYFNYLCMNVYNIK